MGIIFVWIFFVVLTCAKENSLSLDKKFQKLLDFDNCLLENNVTLVNGKGDWEDFCYIACILKSGNIIDSNNYLNPEQVIKNLIKANMESEDKFNMKWELENIAYECTSNSDPNDICKTAEMFNACVDNFKINN